MNINAKIYKRIEKHKNPLNKSKIIIRNNKDKIKSFNQITEIQDNYLDSFIKSKSLNKIKTKIKLNKSNIKLPALRNNIYKNNNYELNDSKFTEQFNKNSSTKKIKININSINNLYPKNNRSPKKLISKYGSSYNLKISSNMKSKNIHLSTKENIKNFRNLDRKIMKGNKNIKIPKKKGYKLFTTTKIINNFNNQINQNKNNEIYTLCNNNETNAGKKLDVLFEIEQKVSKIQNCFRKHLKVEENETTKNHNNNIDIISDISLSEEELNFSEEDSINNIDFSLDMEEI